MSTEQIEYQNGIWDKEEALYKALKLGDNNELVESFTSKINSSIMSNITGVVSCMDDRLSKVNGTVRIAGSGILLAREIGLPKVAEIFKKLEGEKITTHNDCGAAGLYAKAENIIDDVPDEVARKVIDKFSLENGFSHEYIGDINNPHAARSVFVDTTAKFNPIKFDGLPEAFVITEKFIPTKHVIDQINVSINIASGSHGFGEKINKQNPFFIFVLGEQGINKELDDGIEKIKQERDGIVEVKYINV